MKLNLLMGVVVLAVSCTLMACGSGRCDSSNCTGCCSAAGQCESGDVAPACGATGRQCGACAITQRCVSGACVGLTGSGGGTGTGGGLASGGGTGTGGGGGSSSAPTCVAGTDCPYWYCNCQSGPPVNSQRCVNNRCQDAAQSCGSACAGFNTCWLGTAGGGFTGGSNSGPSTCAGTGGGTGGGTATGGGGGSASCAFTDLGKGCTLGSDCQSNLCFGLSPSFICTRACVSANDCPLNWTCDATTSGGKVCMSGKTSGTPSASNVCVDFTYTDIGGPCTNCQSKYCIGSACTRRCDVNADCPSPWTCKTGSDSFKSCRP